ncbi:ABC transporter, partial [mine drainage metagenome]
GAVAKWAGIAILLGLAAYLAYGSAELVLSLPVKEWDSLLAQTPFLLLSMGADYLRVFLVAGAALVVSITLGYYLATHPRANAVIAPVIQTVAAYPAPTYFPLLVGATIGFLVTAFPFGYVELYVFILGFLSCFYYVFFDFWIGVLAIPSEFWEVMDNHELGFRQRMRRVILPATFPYLITGISSTINSAWAGIAIAEFWPDIVGNRTLVVKIGMMKFIGENLASGNTAAAAWVSVLFAVVVVFYGIFFTRNLMDLARRRYVVEEGVYAG